MKKCTVFAANLRLFDGEGGTAGSDGVPASGQQAAGENTALDAAKQQDAPEERSARYRKARDEFKQEFDQEFQRNFDRRHRDYKQLSEKAGGLQELADLMAKKYKVEDGSIDKIKQAAMRDDYYWEDLAEEKGMSVEALRELDRVQRQAGLAQLENERMKGERQAREQMEAWGRDAEEMMHSYPEFRLENEVCDAQFLSLLRSGIPMTHAYEVLHMDDIKGRIAKSAAQEAERKVVDGIRANGLRPQENGASGASAATIKSVSAYSRQERAEMAKRAERGEVITLA